MLFYNAGFVHFCSPVRLEFLAHVFCECCGKSLHISLVVVVKEDSKLHYIHTMLLTKPYDRNLRQLYVTEEFTLKCY